MSGAMSNPTNSPVRAARTVRPVKSTSSTSTTTRPDTSKSMLVTASGSTGRSPMSSR